MVYCNTRSDIYLYSVTGANPVSYTCDANGNITGMGSRVLTYNQNNRLIKVEENGSVLGEYIYNGLGQRAVKQVGANTIYFIYDFDGNLIAEAALDGSITVSYLYMGQNRMARVNSSGSFLYYLNDSLGTPQMLTDETNTVVWEGLYKPFGEADVNPNSTITNNFRFPGQYYDEETGLHYNYHRYYDPKKGRYLTPDPIGLDGGINPFAYTENNPINYIDHDGKFIGKVWGAIKCGYYGKKVQEYLDQCGKELDDLREYYRTKKNKQPWEVYQAEIQFMQKYDSGYLSEAMTKCAVMKSKGKDRDLMLKWLKCCTQLAWTPPSLPKR